MPPRSRALKADRDRDRPQYATFITAFSATIIVGVFFKHCVVDGRPLLAFFYPSAYPYPHPAYDQAQTQLQQTQQGGAVGVTPGQIPALGNAQAGAVQAAGLRGVQLTQVPQVTQGTQVTKVPEVTQVTQVPEIVQRTQLPEVKQVQQVPQVVQQVPEVIKPQPVPEVTQSASVVQKVPDLPLKSNGPGGNFELLQGREVVWQIPAGSVKGVVFLAHSCGSKAVDYWPTSSSCPTCKGLPEEVRFTAAVVTRGYAAVAISSKLACWKGDMPASNYEDVTSVADILQSWREKHRLLSVPAAGFGVSSGGYFVSVLAHVVKFEALVLMVSCGVAKAFLEKGEMEGPYPPTLFVYMDRDARSTKWIVENMQRLESVGAETAQIICKEKALTETYLSERIEGVTPELSMRIYNALANAQCVNGTGYLKPTYKRTWEQDVASASVQISALMVPRVGAELHAAFGFHAFTAEYSEDMVDWLEGVCHRQGNPPNKRCKKFA